MKKQKKRKKELISESMDQLKLFGSSEASIHGAKETKYIVHGSRMSFFLKWNGGSTKCNMLLQ